MRHGGHRGPEGRTETALGLQDRLRAEYGLPPRAGGTDPAETPAPSPTVEPPPHQQPSRTAASAPDDTVLDPPARPDASAETDTLAIAEVAADEGNARRRFRLPSFALGSGSQHTRPPPLPMSIYIGTLIINVLALALPLVILQVYDRVLPNESTATLSFLVLGLIGVLLLDTAMKIARAYVVGWVAADHEYKLASDAMERILSTPSRIIEQDADSVHIDRMNAIDALRELHGAQSRLLVLDLPFVAVFLGLLALIGGFLVIVPIVLFVFLASISMERGRALKEILETRARHDDRRYDFIIESLSGIDSIKMMAMEPQIQRRFERLQKVGAVTSHETILLGNAVQTIGALFSNLTMVSVVSVGALMVIHGQLTMGALAACTLLSGRTIQPLLKGLGLWTQMQRLSVARDRLDELFALGEATAGSKTPVPEVDGAVTLSGATFRYKADEKPVLNGISIRIEPGAIIGLRGSDGSGKSTLLRLICGELQPSEGEVRIDDHSPHAVDPAWVSKWVAQVPTDAQIFHGTILENLTMFQNGQIIDDAREAARMIGLERDIHRLPAGYDTILSEGISDGFPIGFLQRIAIARALARRPRILLFDEANTGIDAQSDASLREALASLKGSTTVIIVSLRPSLLRIAGNVYSLLDGHLYDISGEYVESQPQPMPAVREGA